jgi:hypothetical protein
MKALQALGSGAAGAAALTLIHESARRGRVPNAPRADVLGMRALAKASRAVDREPPSDDALFRWAFAGDLVANSLYYSLVGLAGKRWTWPVGAALGLGAGVGAVALPGPLGLGKGPSGRTWQTKAMTVAWYLAGGLAAAGAASLLGRNEEEED